MEADTLSTLDAKAVRPTFQGEAYTRWLENTKEKRVARFVTDYSKQKAKELVAETEKG